MSTCARSGNGVISCKNFYQCQKNTFASVKHTVTSAKKTLLPVSKQILKAFQKATGRQLIDPVTE